MMPIRWPSYVLLLLTAFFGWVLPYVLPRIWQAFTRTKRPEQTTPALLVASNPRAEPISVRFHLAALLFVGFLGFGILWIPLLFSVRGPQGILGSLLLISTVIPMVIVLFYCLRKGDLSWSAPRSRDEKSDERRKE